MKKLILGLFAVCTLTSFSMQQAAAFNAAGFGPAMEGAQQAQCMNNCIRNGDSNCKSQCSFITDNDDTAAPSMPISKPEYKTISKTDYKCMSDCTSQKYSYGYCQHQCSY